jgi:peptidoglycan/xylan/chitin deacetylase (PgdA/CDA1 family)
VAITFDDGYVDTLRQAQPRLAAAGVPATLFLATAFVGQGVEYWWDELARGILERNDALDEVVTIGGAACRLTLSAVDDATGDSASWRASEPPRTERERLYYALWDRLRILGTPERDAAMDALRTILRAPSPRPGDLPMTAAEVRALATDGVFEIGGHTASHPVLPALTPEARRHDIREGKAACERLIGRTPAGFAYPHGANDADSRAAVAECGFGWACTTEAAPLPASVSDWYALPRIAVLDWDAATFARTLQEASA